MKKTIVLGTNPYTIGHLTFVIAYDMELL